MHLALQQVDVVLDHVEPARRRRQACNPVHPDHPAPQGGERQGMDQPARAAVLSLHPLARLARADILDHIVILPHPEGEAAYQRPSLGPTEVSSKRPVVTLAQNLCSQPAAGGNAQPVGRTLPPTVQQATPHQEHPPRRRTQRIEDRYAMSVDWPAERRRIPPDDVTKERVRCQLQHQVPDESLR